LTIRSQENQIGECAANICAHP